MDMHVVAAQIAQADIPEDNIGEMLRVINKHEESTICFPECALTGIGTSVQLEALHTRLAVAARLAGSNIIYGTYTDAGHHRYNEVRIVNRLGNLLFTHRKHKLWYEDGVVPGDQLNQVVELDGVKVGVVTCWEIAFPELVRALVQQGAQVIFCPAYWYGRKYGTDEVIEMLPQVRAFENQCFVVLCDAGNDENSKRTRICSPLKVLAAASPQAGTITADLHLDDLVYMREVFDCWKV